MFSRRLAVCLAVIGCLVGCSDDDVLPPAVADGRITPPPDRVNAPGNGCGFPAAPRRFALPAVAGLPAGSLQNAPSASATCTNGHSFTYELRDMNGDRRLDLFVRATCFDPNVGPFAWLSYPNVGSGFASDPVRYPLPLPRPPDCAAEQLVDVDGDLAPDLVTTSSCIDSAVGTTRWLVARNNGAGFDARASFALPTATTLGAYTRLAHEPVACPGQQPGYRVFDIDGDRKVDLVITTACEDPRIGTVAWRVHRGTGTGFEPTPQLFALPEAPIPTPGMYGDTSSTAPPDCSRLPSGRPARVFRLVDLDGDFAPELLVTSICADAQVGSTRWLVYRNQKTGFAQAPEVIPLPVVPGSLGVPNVFRELTGAAACDQRRPEFTLMDVDGDERRDLLVTRACGDATTGVSQWLMYRGGPSGFEAASDVALPRVLAATPSSRIGLSGTASCGAAPRPTFSAVHLDGPRLSLVVTRSCQDTSVGTTHWLVHDAGCE